MNLNLLNYIRKIPSKVVAAPLMTILNFFFSSLISQGIWNYLKSKFRLKQSISYFQMLKNIVKTQFYLINLKINCFKNCQEIFQIGQQ